MQKESKGKKSNENGILNIGFYNGLALSSSRETDVTTIKV